MSSQAPRLHILLVEDDPENLELLVNTLPETIGDYAVDWEPCPDFGRARELILSRRYDCIVTDIYRDRPNKKKGIDTDDNKASNLIEAARAHRFCPIVAFSDGSKPPAFPESDFVLFADKSAANDDILAKLRALLDTGIPGIARRLHDELDGITGRYLWGFLESTWQDLGRTGCHERRVLERLIRRRAAIQLGRLDSETNQSIEVSEVEGVEYYIYPPISPSLRLGTVLRSKNDQGFSVVVTPHCHLQPQPGDQAPRAEFVLTVPAVNAAGLLGQKPLSGNSPQKKLVDLRRRIGSPAMIGKPSGRYWFLPGFLDIPDSLCDFCQMKSIPFPEIEKHFDRIAVLDSPFAEALQSCFSSFYSAVGLPAIGQAFLAALRDRCFPSPGPNEQKANN